MVKYICLYCSKESSKKSNYIYHYKSCEKNFNDIINKYKKYSVTNMFKEYANAIINIFDEKNKDKFKCDSCSKIYETYTGLKKHVLKNNCNEVRESICDRIKRKYKINEIKQEEQIEMKQEKKLEINQKKLLNNQLKQKPKYKKASIPHALKRSVWNYWIGERIGLNECLCCEITLISQMTFHCGHIISEANGGNLEVNNLKPICQSCNSSMGTQNMNNFKQKYGLGNKKALTNDV